jgi:hypothetical protein
VVQVSGSTSRWVTTVPGSVTAVTALVVAASALGNPLVTQMPTAAAEPTPATPVQTIAMAPPPPGFPANWVYANDQQSYIDQTAQPPAQDKLNGKPPSSGVRDAQVACIPINGCSQNHGDETATRSGFVLNDQGSWTF